MSAINTNLNSLTAQRSLSSTTNSLSTAMARLSSGLRVNSAKDDAAGLAIAERMNSQTRGMNVAIRNSNDAISLAQTAEGALGVISSNLQRMRELAVQGANGTNNSSDVSALDNEFKLLAAENTRVAASTKFNGQSVIAAATFDFQVGADSTTNDKISVTATSYAGTSSSLGTANSTALAEISKLDADIKAISDARSTWGATQNRFDAVISNLRVSAENSEAARGRIMDADYAQETAALSRAQVLQQAGTAMVAQANQGPQSVLALLR